MNPSFVNSKVECRLKCHNEASKVQNVMCPSWGWRNEKLEDAEVYCCNAELSL